MAPIVLLDSLEKVWRILGEVPCEKAIAGGLALSYWGYPRTAVSSIRVLSCEDLILFKACSGRLIDLADIQELRERNQSTLDQTYLVAWSKNLGVQIPDS